MLVQLSCYILDLDNYRFKSGVFCPVANFQIFIACSYRRHGQNKDSFVLSPIQFTPLTGTRQDKTVLSCPCRRCEHAIRCLVSVLLEAGTISSRMFYCIWSGMLNFSTRCVSGLYFSLFGCTFYSVWRLAVARSSRRHTVLQVLPDWFQHYCWRLHQWPGGVVGYFPACRATEAVTFSRQEQRCTRNSGRTTLRIVFVDVSLLMKLKSHSEKTVKSFTEKISVIATLTYGVIGIRLLLLLYSRVILL